MNKILALVIAATLLSFSAKSQDTVHLSKKYRMAKTGRPDVITDRPPQAVYAELYGRALIYSFNYDRRFAKRLDGLGFSGGIGVLALDGESFIAVPVSLNYLIGKHGRYFETGAGITFANADVISFNDISSSNNSTVFGTLTLGYRRQPIDGGFNFRAGINFLAGDAVFIPYPYVSFGINF